MSPIEIMKALRDAQRASRDMKADMKARLGDAESVTLLDEGVTVTRTHSTPTFTGLDLDGIIDLWEAMEDEGFEPEAFLSVGVGVKNIQHAPERVIQIIESYSTGSSSGVVIKAIQQEE